MVVSTSALWEFIDALIAMLRADTTLTNSATYNLLVVDGPLLLEAARPNTLFVGGAPGDKDMNSPDGGFQQKWAELGARRRDEDLTVQCELWCRAGDNDLSARRATAKAIMAEIESALRINFTLSIARLVACQVLSGDLYQGQMKQGTSVRLPFVIAANARLASQ